MKRILSRKLAFVYTAIIIGIISLSAFAFYRYNIYILLSNGISNVEQFGNSTMAQVDMQIKSMDVNSIELASNFDLINSLNNIVSADSPSNDSEVSKSVIKSILVKNYINKVNIYRISIFTIYGDIFTTGNTDLDKNGVKDVIFKSRWYKDIVVQSGRRIYMPPAVDPWDSKSGTKVISLIRAIKNGEKVIGYIEVQQKLEVIEKICKNEWNNVNLNIALVGRDGSIFYSNITRTDRDKYVKSIVEKTMKESARVVETSSELISVTDSNYTEYKSYLILDKSVLFNPMKLILWYLFLVVLILIIFSGVFISIITQKLTKPIRTFVKKMEKLDLTNLKEPFDYISNDYETEVLNHSFKEMKSRLNESLSKQLAMEAIQTKTLFNILQSEIGPHFLYNSLGSIANMCENGDSEDAAEACYNLSEILRYASDFESTIVTIKEESENLKAYLSLMKSRYRQRLGYTIEIDEKTYPILLPKLTFQPLVENAIKYSLIENDTVFVSIKSFIENNYLILKVSDNGSGINNEKLEEINKILSNDQTNLENIDIKSKVKFGGMGLIGTLLRLKLYEGELFSYHIANNDESGMTISIKIEIENISEELNNTVEEHD